jgi:hypothetical protein
MVDDFPPLPTLEDLARVFQCNIVTVRRSADAGEFKTTKIRNIERIPWSEWHRLTGDDKGEAA